jgi:hypothetical protein
MLCHVAVVSTDASEERIASIIRVIGIDELGKMLAVTSNRSTLQRNTDYERGSIRMGYKTESGGWGLLSQ